MHFNSSLLQPSALPSLRTMPAYLLPILDQARMVWGQETAPRWQQMAAHALRQGWWKWIPTRSGDALYMLRFWLSTPRRKDDGDADSGDAVVLHWMVRGDDDQALHDHPWAFEAKILQGGYWEHLPPVDWPLADHLGPAWDLNRVERIPGQFIVHPVHSLHCVGDLRDPAVRPDGSIDITRGSWSHVFTGPRICDWGFHPTGQPWVPFETYLETKRKAQA